MSGSDLGKPVMITQPDSPSAEAFTVAAKNIAAQCSIQYYKMKEEAEAEVKWNGLSPEERQKILDEFTLEKLSTQVPPEHEEEDEVKMQNKTWAELEHAIQDAIIKHQFGESKVQTTPTTS